MYYKVFISSTELAFSGASVSGFEILRNWPDEASFSEWIEIMRGLSPTRKIWVPDPTGERWKFFKEHHKPITAAGGVVVDESGNLLVINRLGKWDLPKGKMEVGERPAETALREVAEECGISGLELGEELPGTYHTYPHKGREVLKHTHWFLMHYRGSETLTPQVEEDISEVKFMTAAEVAVALENTYESLKPLFEVYLARYPFK